PGAGVSKLFRAEPVDELHVELVRSVDRQLSVPVIDDDRSPAAFELLQLVEGRLRIVALLADERVGRWLAEDPMRREDRETGILEADEHDHHVPARGSSHL